MNTHDIETTLRNLRLSGMAETLQTRVMQAQAAQEPFLETLAALLHLPIRERRGPAVAVGARQPDGRLCARVVAHRRRVALQFTGRPQGRPLHAPVVRIARVPANPWHAGQPERTCATSLRWTAPPPHRACLALDVPAGKPRCHFGTSPCCADTGPVRAASAGSQRRGYRADCRLLCTAAAARRLTG